MSELSKVGQAAPVRTLEQVAAEIRGYTASMLANVIEIGRRMTEAKEMLQYGEFGRWIRENTGYSLSTANNFMRIFDAYGAAQFNLFGQDVECQTFGKLSYSKALALLDVPEEEREKFVETNHVEEMSTRELKKAIRERDEARRQLQAELEAAEGTALIIAELETQRVAAQGRAEEAEAKRREAQEKIKELESRPVEVAVKEADPEEIEAAVQEAVDKAMRENKLELERLQGQLAAAEAGKTAAGVEADRAREQLAKAKLKTAKEDGASEARAQLAAAQAAEAKARELAADAEAEAEKLRKQLAMADASTAEFKIRFSSAQAELQRCKALLEQVAAAAKEPCRKALLALCESIAGGLQQ